MSEQTRNSRPKIVGIYGLPGCGKTTLLGHLTFNRGEEQFSFYEGSSVIDLLVPGGINAFKQLSNEEKESHRSTAIRTIAKECEQGGKVGVVTGHFSFWDDTKPASATVITKADLDSYTDIIYLELPADRILSQVQNDMERKRDEVSIEGLQKWQSFEIQELKQLCLTHGICFSRVTGKDGAQERIASTVSELLENVYALDEEYNSSVAKKRMEAIMAGQTPPPTTMFVIDADKTLAAADAGKLFWETHLGENAPDPLNEVFDPRHLGYTYTAFRQATLLYQEVGDHKTFDVICKGIAAEITIHPEFLSLLRKIDGCRGVGAVVVTCGLQAVWEEVLTSAGFSGDIKVIGGGQVAHGLVVTPEVKKDLVIFLQQAHDAHVWAFGDSPLDLPMLETADQAVVVVGEEAYRSESMDAKLLAMINEGDLRAHQVLLPSNASPRLNTDILPLIEMADIEATFGGLAVIDATTKHASKLLTSSTRDKKVAGPELREAHRRIGWYLATEYLSGLIGLEEYEITNVQGRPDFGQKLRGEESTLTMPLMRGGEPMAFGVNDAFPLAGFMHVEYPTDIQKQHLEGRSQIILVDSVINSGKSVIEFVQHIRNLSPKIPVFIVANVVQEGAVAQDSHMRRELAESGKLDLVALRLSKNKYTGTGGTDTGHRLFNTTHLD